MNITFLEREFKSGKLEQFSFNTAYLLAIANQHPKVWMQFLAMVKYVESETK